MPTSRWRVPPKFLLRRPDGRWRSYEELVDEVVTRAPRGCRRTNLADAVGLQPAELDVITNRLAAGGRIERNMRSTGRRPVTLFESPRGEIFWGVRA